MVDLFYPEDFVQKVIKLFPEEKDLHLALAWGHQSTVLGYLQSRNINQLKELKGADKILSSKVFSLSPEQRKHQEEIKANLEAQKLETADLISRLNQMQEEILLKTSLYHRSFKRVVVH